VSVGQAPLWVFHPNGELDDPQTIDLGAGIGNDRLEPAVAIEIVQHHSVVHGMAVVDRQQRIGPIAAVDPLEQEQRPAIATIGRRQNPIFPDSFRRTPARPALSDVNGRPSRRSTRIAIGSPRFWKRTSWFTRSSVTRPSGPSMERRVPNVAIPSVPIRGANRRSWPP